MTICCRRLEPGELDHERLWLSIGALALVILVAPGADLAFATLACPWKTLTGWPCLGCGSTRALQALARGSLLVALRMNPVVTVAVAGCVAWGLLASMMLALDLPRWRVTLAPADRPRLAWVGAMAAATTWLFLVLDGR